MTTPFDKNAVVGLACALANSALEDGSTPETDDQLTRTIEAVSGRIPSDVMSAGGDPTPTLPDQVGGQLSPTWVEWLMGYPAGWTDLKPSETALSRSAPSGSDDR